MVVDLGAAALRYAARGVAVMPLHTPTRRGCSCRYGAQCSSPGKHPRLRHGVHDASVDPAVVAGWWRRWPQANIAVATGGLLDVCDIDTNTALVTVLDLLDVVRPAGPVVLTGDGWHLWFAATGHGGRIGMLPGVDWRGAGGSAVVPPSRHHSGRRYRFQQPWDGLVLPPVPQVLRSLIVPAPPPVPSMTAEPVADAGRYAQAALDGEVDRVLRAARPVFRHGQRVAGGGRNSAVNVAAFRLGQLAATGVLDEAVVWPRLTDAAIATGLPLAEVRRTIASGWRAGLRRPRC